MKEKINPIDLSVGILLSVIVMLLFAQVLFRYLFNFSLHWTEELAKYLFVWMTFIGSVGAFKDRIHIGVDFFIELLPERFKYLMKILDILLITCFSGIAAVVGYLWTIDVWGTLSPALGLSISLILYAAFPTASIIICVLGIRQLQKEAITHTRKEESK